MCDGNVEVSTRKKVLAMVHDMAVHKSMTGLVGEQAEKQLTGLMRDWIDELAEEHKPTLCKTCGHKYD